MVCGSIKQTKETQESESNYTVKSTGEFDPGSERTLAACLTHASRT